MVETSTNKNNTIKPDGLIVFNSPPIAIPVAIITAPPRPRLIPVTTSASVFCVTIRVNIPPKAEHIALINNIPSPCNENAVLSVEPKLMLIIKIPANPSRQPIDFFNVKCSFLKIIQASIIRINVLEESIIDERAPGKLDSPI